MIAAGLFGLSMAGAAFAGQPTECDSLAGSPTDPNRVGAGIGLYGIEPVEAIAACGRTLAADPNNPRLLFNLGRAHEASGRIGSVSVDEMALAGRTYKSAADQNYPAAQIALAPFYWRGSDGFQQDTRQAMLLLDKAMASDATEAKSQRRNLFADTAFAVDPNEAQLQFVKEAANAGDADALYALGLPLSLGEDRQADVALLWHQAAALGSAQAAFDLARMYFKGKGGLSTNPEESLRLILKAAAGDDPQTWDAAATAYERGSYGLPKDDKQAARLFKQASDEGNKYALYDLGRFYEEGKGGLPKDPREAARLYKLAADQGNDDAVLALARDMAEGRGGYEADRVKAIAFLKRAARWSTQAKDELTKMGG
ncbi:sel1 repeat family protein [Mesorhizobium sp. AR07]|uniref:SEL1-like repeat protein n=1 Tax=Mesorhizobium sp. AR07 TaxID=2865838 RepID=UPI002160B740|nr:tetratricopeptide repeat protein [Mesorhizobium sp. AR07]UVK45826.1 sel1 repeat family protein [Mesorhizobium sp. AR07]